MEIMRPMPINKLELKEALGGSRGSPSLSEAPNARIIKRRGSRTAKSQSFFTNVLQLDGCHYGSRQAVYFISGGIRKKIKGQGNESGVTLNVPPDCKQHLLLITQHLFRSNCINDVLCDTSHFGANSCST